MCSFIYDRKNKRRLNCPAARELFLNVTGIIMAAIWHFLICILTAAAEVIPAHVFIAEVDRCCQGYREQDGSTDPSVPFSKPP